MFVWSFTLEMPRSHHHDHSAISLVVATPNLQIRKFSYQFWYQWFMSVYAVSLRVWRECSIVTFISSLKVCPDIVLQSGFEQFFLYLFQWKLNGFSLYWPLFQPSDWTVGKRDPFFNGSWSWPGIYCSSCSESSGGPVGCWGEHGGNTFF